MEQPRSRTILDLHEDFLLQIFEHCDIETQVQLSEVNKHFRKILRRKIFLKIKTCKIVINTDSDEYAMWKIPKCIGRYATKLDIDIWYKDDDFLMRYFQMLCKNAGNNVRKLNMNRIRMTNELLEPMKLILKGLDVLKNWNFDRKCNRSIGDLQTICPHLVKLTLYKGVNFVESTAWPTLTKLSIKYLPLQLKMFTDFVALNPQITSLKISCKSQRWLTVIAKHLPNLEKFTFFKIGEYHELEADITVLKQLKQLIKLSLPSSYYHIEEFLLYVATFSELHELKFNDNFIHHSSELIQYPLLKLAQQLTHLQVFHFPLYYPDKETIIEFVGFAKCLKEIFIGYDDVAPDESWINDLVNVRKLSQLKGEKGLKLLITSHDVNYTLIKELVESRDRKQYLVVVTASYSF